MRCHAGSSRPLLRAALNGMFENLKKPWSMVKLNMDWPVSTPERSRVFPSAQEWQPNFKRAPRTLSNSVLGVFQSVGKLVKSSF